MKMRNAIISKKYPDPVYWPEGIWRFKLFVEGGFYLKLVGDIQYSILEFENGPCGLLLFLVRNNFVKSEDYII